MPGYIVQRNLSEDHPFTENDSGDDSDDSDDDQDINMGEELAAFDVMMTTVEMRINSLAAFFDMRIAKSETIMTKSEMMLAYTVMMLHKFLLMLETIAKAKGIDIKLILAQLPMVPSVVPTNAPGVFVTTVNTQPDPTSFSAAVSPGYVSNRAAAIAMFLTSIDAKLANTQLQLKRLETNIDTKLTNMGTRTTKSAMVWVNIEMMIQKIMLIVEAIDKSQGVDVKDIVAPFPMAGSVSHEPRPNPAPTTDAATEVATDVSSQPDSGYSSSAPAPAVAVAPLGPDSAATVVADIAMMATSIVTKMTTIKTQIKRMEANIDLRFTNMETTLANIGMTRQKVMLMMAKSGGTDVKNMLGQFPVGVSACHEGRPNPVPHAPVELATSVITQLNSSSFPPAPAPAATIAIPTSDILPAVAGDAPMPDAAS